MPGTLIHDSTSMCAVAGRNDAPVGISSVTELLMGVGMKVMGCIQAGGGPMLHSAGGFGIKVTMSSRIEEYLKKSVPW